MALPFRSPLLYMLVLLLNHTIQHSCEKKWKIILEGFSWLHWWRSLLLSSQWSVSRLNRRLRRSKIIQLEGHELLLYFPPFADSFCPVAWALSRAGANEAATSPGWCPTNRTVFFLGKVVDVFWRYPCQRVLLIVLGVAVSVSPSQHNCRHRLETIPSSFNLINIYEVSKWNKEIW